MSGKYNAARDAFGDGRLSWTGAKIVAQLVSAAYAFKETHTDARDLKGHVGKPVELTGKSIKDGYAKAANIRFNQVTGDDVVAIVLRRESAEERDKTLIVYLDQIAQFPMKPNGGDIVIDAPANGFFRV